MRVSKTTWQVFKRSLLRIVATFLMMAGTLPAGAWARQPLDTERLADQILSQVRTKSRSDALRIAVLPFESHFERGQLTGPEVEGLEKIATQKGMLGDVSEENMRVELSKGFVSHRNVSLINRVRVDRAMEQTNFGRSGEAWMADPEKIARLGEAIDANYLAIPAMVQSFREVEWDPEREEKVPRQFKTRTAVEVWLVSVSSGDAVAIAETERTEHYHPTFSAAIRSIKTSAEGFEICLAATGSDVYGRALAVGILAEDEQGRPLTTQAPDYGLRNGSTIQLAHHQTVGPETGLRGIWDNICSFIPSQVFETPDRIGPYPATRQFRFKACIWELSQIASGGPPVYSNPNSRWFRIYSTQQGAKIVEY